MITHSPMFTRQDDGSLSEWDDVREYRMQDRSWGKYDSGFHAWLVEQVESDDHNGDTDYGGAVLYGRYVDYWDSCGFHALARFDTRDEARAAFEEWSSEFYAWDSQDEEES